MSALARRQRNALVHVDDGHGSTLCGASVRLSGLDLTVTCARCIAADRPPPPPRRRAHGWRVGMPYRRHVISGV